MGRPGATAAPAPAPAGRGRRAAGRAARTAALAALAAILAAWPARPLEAVSRAVARDVRGAYEGRTLRLRVDLRSAAHAVEPNVLSLGGMGYGREGSPILFHRLTPVFLERVMSEGGSRMSLTIYTSGDEARNLRATAIPAPALGNPAATMSQAAFARAGSTTVILELAAGRKEADAQRREITLLMDRLFYVDSEPSREEAEAFVLEHRGWPVSRLAALTGLTPDDVRALVTGTPRPAE